MREKNINEYKCDLYIEDTKTIIEIKSVISTSDMGVFPIVYSERSLNQLSKIKELLQSGYRVDYIIVSLNPYVKGIEFLKNTQFYVELEKCINLGMSVHAFNCKVQKGAIYLNEKLTIY